MCRFYLWDAECPSYNALRCALPRYRTEILQSIRNRLAVAVKEKISISDPRNFLVDI